MNKNNLNFELVLANSNLLAQKNVDSILACNESTKKYGLILNEKQALAILKTRSKALEETKRLEFSTTIIDDLILTFCDSSYITKNDYEDTIHELIVLFYELKNNTWDTISDTELINFMKKAFESSCYGSLELLSGTLLRFIEHIHLGKSIKTFRLEE